jgi:hypothetical protein
MGSAFFVRGMFNICLFEVYHVPRETVLTSLPKTCVGGEVEFRSMLGQLASIAFGASQGGSLRS